MLIPGCTPYSGRTQPSEGAAMAGSPWHTAGAYMIPSQSHWAPGAPPCFSPRPSCFPTCICKLYWLDQSQLEKQRFLVLPCSQEDMSKNPLFFSVPTFNSDSLPLLPFHLRSQPGLPTGRAVQTWAVTHSSCFLPKSDLTLHRLTYHTWRSIWGLTRRLPCSAPALSFLLTSLI